MRPLRPRLMLALAVAYPPTAHICLAEGHPRIAASTLLCLIAVAATVRAPAAFSVLTTAAALALAFTVPAAPLLLYLPPIAIPLGLGLLFGRSLLPGRRPLVSAFAEEVMGERRPERAGYTRGVTWLWTVVFAGLVIESTVLALTASTERWSLFANLINYLIIGAVFVLEFLWRSVHFREQPAPLAFVRALIAADWRHLGR